MNSNKFYEILNQENNEFTNNPELIKMLIEYKGKEGHEKIQKKLFKELINRYVELTKKLDQKIEQITTLAETDQLTKIYNRVKFMEELEKEINRVEIYKNKLSLIMFDIDHFKRVNDNYGHDIGDKVLIKITNIVTESIRGTDIFARWGGEEFMILNPNTSLSCSIKLAEKIRKNIEQNKIKKVGQITCSFGVTKFKGKDDFDSFTKRVDNALYQAKENGRNRVISIN
ncbi:GGDEF domain-containing protein [Natroniella sp. ANB-PHB2]|uniref:GGDEF domain-containing protein n=1 Tax=Natroniella sp. ANB-PHB2 TaxID=3384444 RepID=UPI0038D3A573